MAYDALLSWKPVEGAAGYRVYLAPADASEGVAPIDVGAPPAGGDGLLRYVVEDVPLAPESYFAIAAYDESGRESDRSNALVLTQETVASVLAADGDGDYTQSEVTADAID